MALREARVQAEGATVTGTVPRQDRQRYGNSLGLFCLFFSFVF